MIGKIFIAILLMAHLQGCGLSGEAITETQTETTEQSTDNSTYKGGEDDAPPSDPLDLMANQLAGTWIGPCRDDIRVIYVFTKSQWIRGTAIFSSGSNCEVEEILSTYDIGGYLTLEESIDPNKVNWRGDIVTFERAFYTQDIVDHFNSIAFHGYSDWKVNERKQCIGKPESDGGPVINEQSIYSVFEFSDSGTLAIGQWVPASDQRTGEISWDGADGGPFTKQAER